MTEDLTQSTIETTQKEETTELKQRLTTSLPLPQTRRLSPMERRRQSMQTSAQSRLDFITGKATEIKQDEVKEEQPKEEEKKEENEQSAFDKIGQKMEENGVGRKLGMISLGFLVLFFGIFFGHFMGYTLFGSEFFSGFACCLALVVAGICSLLKKLIIVLPKVMGSFSK